MNHTSTDDEAKTASVSEPLEFRKPPGVEGEASTQRMPVEGDPVRWIMTGIFAWAVVLAGGVVWYDAVAGRIIWWKPVVIVVCAFSFVSLWRLAITRRAARQKIS